MEKQKYEREIEEILAKYDKEAERKKPAPPPGRAVSSLMPEKARPVQRRPGIPTNWKRFGAGQYIAASFLVAFLAILARGFSPILATVLVIVSVVLFLVPIVLYRSTGTTSGGWSLDEQKRWRGQIIDFSTRRNVTNDPFAGVKRWFRRR